MKKVVAVVLAVSLAIGLCYVMPAQTSTVQAAKQEWQELGNNDSLGDWQTCSEELESQTITFSPISVTKLRLYVTDIYGGEVKLREFEAFGTDDENKFSSELYDYSKVTVTTNIVDKNTDDELRKLYNGNAGTNGWVIPDYDRINSDWDNFVYNPSSTDYIELEFVGEAVELDSVKLWATWCNGSWGGNAPKKWRVEGLVEIPTVENFRELGNNDALGDWRTGDTSLEVQEIVFTKPVTVTKLRLYVTETYYNKEYRIREFEAVGTDGVNKASPTRWDESKVKITTTLSETYKGELKYLCNGNGGTTGWSNAENNRTWDYFTYPSASATEYIEIEFTEGPVDISSVRLWATNCYSPANNYGDAPKKWKVEGLVEGESEEVLTADGFMRLGDNSQSTAWKEGTITFENQEIVFDEPVWLSKLRVKVTDIYGTEGYRISEFEAFNTDGVNVLASVTGGGFSDPNSEFPEHTLTSDGCRRSSLATINFAENMSPATYADKMVDGENCSHATKWYERNKSDAALNLEDEYIEFVFDRPYEIASVKLWSNYCNGGDWGWGPKTWEVYGYRVQQKIVDDLTNPYKWREVAGFKFAGEQVVPALTGESVMYSGNLEMKDYRVETEIQVTKGQLGLTTHYVDTNNYYRAVVDKDADKVLLYKGANQIAEKYWPIAEKITLAITVNENKVSVWADEVKMMDYIDSTPLEAGIYGVYAKDASGYFESVTVSPIDVADVLPADYPYEPTAQIVTGEMTSGDFYVSENGSDSNNGTNIDTPFQTIQKAQEAVRVAKAENPNKDYTIILRGGTYYLDNTISMTAADSGAGDYRVTYVAYKDETPIISGGKKVTGTWEAYAGKEGVYVTTLPEAFHNVDIRQMFVEDTRATRSREPDIGETENNVRADGYWDVSSVADDFTWISPSGQIASEWASLSGVEYFGRATQRYYRQIVDQFDIANNRLTVKSGKIGVRSGETNVSATQGDWLYFENALLFVDTPGEWYYDNINHKLYYYPENGANPNNLNITIPCVETLIDMTGTEDAPVENLNFVGLRFSHTTWRMPDCGRVVQQAGRYLLYENNTDTNPSLVDPSGALKLEYAEKINIQDCDFTMLGEDGVNIVNGAHSNRIEGCTFTDIGAHGVYVGYTDEQTPENYDSDEVPHGNVIRENYLNSCGVVEKSAVGICGTFLNHTTIEYNTIMHMPYSGISVGWNWDSGLYSSHHNKINHNYVYDVMTQMHNGGGIYVLGSQYNNEINDNRIKDTRLNNIYMGEGSRFTKCEGNYLSYADIFYNSCSLDELSAVYVGENYIATDPEDLGAYGYPIEVMGDANYDGKADIRDLVRIKKYIDKKSVKIDKVASDFNSDTVIDKKDVAELRKVLIADEVITETSYNGETGYTDLEMLEITDYLTTETFVLSEAIANADTEIAKKICDANYSSAYVSSNDVSFPEQFVFRFEEAIAEKTILQLVSDYADRQGASKIEIYVQKGTGRWQQIQSCTLNWMETDDMQSIKIPLNTVGVTALKVVVDSANTVWEGKYIISEMDLYTSDEKTNYQLVFADEFNGNEVDSTKWLTQYFPHSTTDTEAAATKYRMEDGKLCLYIDEDTKLFSSDTADMKVSSIQTLEKKGLHSNTPDVRDVDTYESFACQYGYFEMRAKIPSCGGGGHVAWWLVGAEEDKTEDEKTVQNGEIDIMEAAFEYPNLYSPKIHKFDDSNLVEYKQEIGLQGDYVNEYHIYAMDWRPSGLAFYVDGKEVASTTYSPNYRMAMFLGIYTGCVDFSGADNGVYPKEFYVDYVRVYQDKNGYDGN